MQAVIDKIMEAKSVAVLTHLNEDPDTIGSCFAFAKVMRKLGKEATVYVNGRIESRLAFIGDDYVLASPLWLSLVFAAGFTAVQKGLT